jgi:NAD(P)-dependent dehydrogenase (short-subunit alcohol dehydrogenase family)
MTDWKWNDGRRFEGRVALVTGAGGDLGGTVARALGGEGATVVLGYRSSRDAAAAALEEVEAAGAAGHLAQLDVCDEESVTSAVEDAAARYGRLDVVVNAAGRWTAAEEKRFEASSAADFAKLLNVDVLGTYRVCKAALKHLRATGNGSIVNFATSYGPGLNPDNPANFLSATYVAAKGAIRTFTSGLARDIAPEIRVNAVAPGAIAENWEEAWDQPREVMEEVLAATPLKRMGLQQHIAEAVLYLASDGAGFTTGQVIEVSGGWTLAW